MSERECGHSRGTCDICEGPVDYRGLARGVINVNGETISVCAHIDCLNFQS